MDVKLNCLKSLLPSCHAASTDIPDPLSPLLPIVHRSWLVLQGYTPNLHIAAVCSFELVVLLLLDHRSTSLISSSLLLKQCPACLVRLTWIVFVMGGRWPYSWCSVGCCLQDLFEIVRSILVYLPSSFFSSRFVSVHIVHPHSSIETTAAWKTLRFILSVRSDGHMTDSLSVAVHAFINLVPMSFLVE